MTLNETSGNNRVSVIHCDGYDWDQVAESVDRAVSYLGGWPAFVRPGMRVALKVNLLKRSAPDAHVTTHPALVAAVVRGVKSQEGIPVIGDSPGGPYHKAVLSALYRETGMDQVANITEAKLNRDVSVEEVEYPAGRMLKRIPQAGFIRKADLVINLPKLKTHGMMRYTGGVKNLFGTVPGTAKVELHYRMPETDRFSRMLLDVCGLVNPALTIMDAIWGMEGDGPSAGDPRFIGCVLASPSPYHLDYAAGGIITNDPLSLPTVYWGKEDGPGPSSFDQIQFLGEDYSSLRIPDFRVPRVGGRGGSFSERRRYLAPLEGWIQPRPVFHRDRCTGCGICVAGCPAKALLPETIPPKLDRNTCIRCYCCQELCPNRAISIYQNPLFRWVK